MSVAEKIELEDVPVIFMRAGEDTSAAIQKAWAEFEAAVGLKGRKFYATFDSKTREYRVCARLEDGDDPEALGSEVAT